ncbi:hypothetical protein BST81_05820 [Leptolyngbya sp. 'hensonii']|uniref:hypothetical protein n=1 Tax=Leptolyngbya sp. 'hensonii' TaxID=1922337 RepID=UPI00094FA11C|nr:hypothetical protein [Leptolyngbya sp. 'hensonii']OLP19275.1 hypothetical protein BST81_05820 [Leptolyngbya sp. 'hensonii']
MVQLTIRVSAASMKQWLGAAALGVSLLATGSPMALAVLRDPAASPQDADSSQVAQLFKRPPSNSGGCGPQGCRLTIDQSTLQTGDIVMARYDGKDRQVIQAGETRKLVLTLAEPVVNRSGRTVLPAGGVIEGEIVPVEGGGQFVAQRILVNNTAYNFPAASGTIHDTKDPTQTDAGAIAGDAAIGAAGGIVLGQVLGQRGITLEQILGGAVAGVVVGNVTAPQAVVINPGDKIELRLTDNFRL